MKLFLILIFFIIFGCGNETGQFGHSSISFYESEIAYRSHDLKEALSILEQLYASTETPDSERASATRSLGRINWLIHRNMDAADSLFSSAETFENNRSATSLARSRMFLETSDFASAKLHAAMARERARTITENQSAILMEAEVVIGEAYSSILYPEENKKAVLDKSALWRIHLDLLSANKQDPGLIEPSQLLLKSAVLVEDWGAVVQAWRHYYHIPRRWTENYPLFIQNAETIRSIFLNCNDRPLTRTERIALVEALAGLRFFECAAAVAFAPWIEPENRVDGEPIVRQIIAYNNYIRKVENIAEAYYRNLARGKRGKVRGYLFFTRFFSAGRELWKELDFEGRRPLYSPMRFLEEIEERFGTVVALGVSSPGVHDLHMGHKIYEKDHVVEQYGYKNRIKFVSIDRMVSNGYESWYWDGRSHHGGWAGSSRIVNVRASGANTPVNAWRRMTDPGARAAFHMEIMEKSALDDSLAERDPHSFLPGLALRLQHRAFSDILRTLISEGYVGPELRMQFISNVERKFFESSILAHEGRHIIDKSNNIRVKNRSQGEFYAKLSEIAFAPDPRLAFTGGILVPDIGASTPHGQANLMIIRGMVEWMEDNRGEIEGLDDSRPLLPQLDILTRDQLREAAMSMDPLAIRWKAALGR